MFNLIVPTVPLMSVSLKCEIVILSFQRHSFTVCVGVRACVRACVRTMQKKLLQFENHQYNMHFPLLNDQLTFRWL